MSYPDSCAVRKAGNHMVIDLIKAMTTEGTPIKNYAEIGVYEGDTAHLVAHALEPGATMQLFDYTEKIREVEARLKADESLVDKDLDVRLTPNSDIFYDSYNWSLAQCLMEGLSYDMVFIDGAHTWHHDGMAFMLADKMLRPGGIVVFDDVDWALAISKTMRPLAYPEIVGQYTEDQIMALQVKMIIDLLVKPDPSYEEIIENFAYKKVIPPNGD